MVLGRIAVVRCRNTVNLVKTCALRSGLANDDSIPSNTLTALEFYGPAYNLYVPVDAMLLVHLYVHIQLAVLVDTISCQQWTARAVAPQLMASLLLLFLWPQNSPFSRRVHQVFMSARMYSHTSSVV